MFKRSKRLSDTIRSIEQGYDNVVERLGRWINEREAHLREIRLNRRAEKYNRALDEAQEVMQRARTLRERRCVIND